MSKVRVFYKLNDEIIIRRPTPMSRYVRLKKTSDKVAGPIITDGKAIRDCYNRITKKLNPEYEYAETLEEWFARQCNHKAPAQCSACLTISKPEVLPTICLNCEAESSIQFLDFNDTNEADLPDKAKRDKWRGTKATGLRVDDNVITKQDRRNTAMTTLANEHNKSAPNVKNAIGAFKELFDIQNGES